VNKDQIKGVIKEAAGKVQQKTGELLGSADQQAKGLAKKQASAAQSSRGA
jgi:uncharacterized protein YjbJ (UPF0337 family)